MKKILIKAAKEAGKLLLDNFQTKKAKKILEQKSKLDYSTHMDKMAEDKIIEILRENEIKGKVVAEEIGKISLGHSEYTFFIDPLDGTINYSTGIPIFCTSIGVKKGDKKFFGVVYYPVRKELFFAEHGKGAFLNGKRIHVNNQSELEGSTLEVSVSWGPKDLKNLEKFSGVARLRNIFCAALTTSFVAAGRSDAVIYGGSTSWDFMAASLIVEEAGGIVTDFNGKRWNENSKNFVASNETLHKKIIGVLNG